MLHIEASPIKEHFLFKIHNTHNNFNSCFVVDLKMNLDL